MISSALLLPPSSPTVWLLPKHTERDRRGWCVEKEILQFHSLLENVVK
jgi:hypothetical protein